MNSSSSSSSSNGVNCHEADLILNNFLLTFVRLLQITLAIPTFIALHFFIRIYRKEAINFHPNLKLLMANIVFFYSIHSFGILFVCLRYEFIQLTYGNNPCQFLTPVWMVFVTRLPSYAYSLAQTLFHFAIMLERLRATLFANRYEREGLGWGIACTIGAWILVITFLAYVSVTALEDQETYGQPLILTTLTTKYNTNQILTTFWVALFIVFVTIVGDLMITWKNREIQSTPLGHGANYNLSRNFQIRENIVTMRLILPMDVVYGLMFTIYLVGVLVVRSLYSSKQLTIIQYSFYYDLMNSFLFLYIIFSLLIYIYFIKFLARTRRCHLQKVSIGPAIAESEIYFQQLNSQWASGK